MRQQLITTLLVRTASHTVNDTLRTITRKHDSQITLQVVKWYSRAVSTQVWDRGYDNQAWRRSHI